MSRARRADDDDAALGAKTNCQMSCASPVVRRKRTRALASNPGAKRPESRYTGSIVTLGPMEGAPGVVKTVGRARTRWAAMSRTKFLEPSFHGGTTGLETKRTRGAVRTGQRVETGSIETFA
jgi:hypothetical protein